MAEAVRHGHSIRFTALYYATAATRQALEEEIGEQEGRLIRQHRPPLNTQIPRADNWKEWEWNKEAQTITLT